MLSLLERFKFPLMIQYDNVSFTDGLGAQAIRIVGIYSIARKYRLRYIHSQIIIDHPEEFMGPNYSLESFEAELETIRELLTLPTYTIPKSKTNPLIVNWKTITRRKLFKLILKSIFSRRGIILKLQLPQGITDYIPDVLRIGAEEIRRNFASRDKFSPTQKVVVHIRSGQHTVKTPIFNSRPQLTPYYYKQALKKVDSHGKRIVLHTDFFPEDMKGSDLTFRQSVFKEFIEGVASSSNNSVFHYAPLSDVLYDMVTAEYLIMGNSALSYFAGVINPNTVVWPPIHVHARMNHWIIGPLLNDSRMSFLDPTHH
jgi:hypothetical protein